MAPAAAPCAREVAYEWDLVTDEIRWASSLAEAIGLDDDDGVTTGLGWAEHLVAESPSSRYECPSRNMLSR